MTEIFKPTFFKKNVTHDKKISKKEQPMQWLIQMYSCQQHRQHPLCQTEPAILEKLKRMKLEHFALQIHSLDCVQPRTTDVQCFAKHK
jgi:hypothetical protein